MPRFLIAIGTTNVRESPRPYRVAVVDTDNAVALSFHLTRELAQRALLDWINVHEFREQRTRLALADVREATPAEVDASAPARSAAKLAARLARRAARRD
ncbi:MAG: hypothetical protein ACOYBR_09665 [Fluviibacter sp.]